MGSGAYSVFIDHEAPGGGPTRALRRVVPLPPPELSGGVQFTAVVLSLAYDNFGEAGAPDNPCHGEDSEGQWASPDAQRKHRSWAQILSLHACG